MGKWPQNTVVFRQVIFCDNETHDARATGGALSPYKARVAERREPVWLNGLPGCVA
jgi:hypothetical protein